MLSDKRKGEIAFELVVFCMRQKSTLLDGLVPNQFTEVAAEIGITSSEAIEFAKQLQLAVRGTRPRTKMSKRRGGERERRISFYRAKLGEDGLARLLKARPSLFPEQNYIDLVAFLKQVGVDDPKKIILGLPLSLAYSTELLRHKARFLYRLGITEVACFLEHSVSYLGISHNLYVPVARRLREQNLQPTPKNIFRLLRNRRKHNLPPHEIIAR